MEININEIEGAKLPSGKYGLIILPSNYLSSENHQYSSTSISFYKYTKLKSAPIEFLNTPELLIEQRSADWYGPVLFMTSIALSQNPDLGSIACELIKSYIEDNFKGQPSPEVKMKFLYQETETSRTTEITYEGPLEGLDKLKKSIRQVTSREQEIGK